MITKKDKADAVAYCDEVFDRVDAQQWVDAEGAENIKKQFLAQREEIAALKAELDKTKALYELELGRAKNAEAEAFTAHRDNAALKARIQRARAWLKECQGGHVIALSGINRIDEALKELTQ